MDCTKVNNPLSNKISYAITTSAFVFFLTITPVNAALFDLNESALNNGFSISEEFANIERLENKKRQVTKQVKQDYQLVIKLAMQQKYAEANEKVDALIQQNPKQSIYHNLKAQLQLIDNNVNGAQQSFLQAVQLNAKNSQAYTGLAAIALNNNQFDQARHDANKALAINPYDIRAYQVLTDSVIQLQGIDAAKTALLDAYTKAQGHPDTELAILQLLTKTYINQKQTEKLLPLATGLAKNNQKSVSALSFLADSQLLNKETADAEQTLRQIITQHPKDAEHLFKLARLLGETTGNEAEILSLLDKAANNTDNPALVLSYKVAILIRLKQLRQAYTVAKQVDKISPELSLGKIVLGDAYLAERKYQEALHNYQLAYQITPNIQVLDAILNVLALQNNTTNAIDLLTKELAKNRNNTEIQYRLAVIYQQSGQNNLAIKHYEALLANQQDHVTALNNLAWLYSLQNTPKALKTIEKAYKISPDSAAIADTYGYLLFKNNKIKQSLGILKQAEKLAPLSIEIQLHLAEVFIASKDKAQAKKILQQLIRNSDTHKDEVEKLMEKL